MAAQASDLNLLFGMLAVQFDFISKDQLNAGMKAWILDKSMPLGQILQIDELMQLHLEQAEVHFHISPGIVIIDQLLLRSPNIRLSATGTIKFDGKLSGGPTFDWRRSRTTRAGFSTVYAA